MSTYLDMKRRHTRELHDLIRQAIREAGGNKYQAAKNIGMDRGAMLRMIREHGIRLEDQEAA